jgi:DNA-binding transcriptional MerR regulator
MYGIGTVARLAQVSVRTLRYYDELGLLRPMWADPDTGYRWYAPDQLQRLHRILALRDLGVTLADIGRLLDEGVSAEQLRGILLLRRAEATERLALEAERLARVEARLRQLEEREMADYDIVVKGVEAVWAAVLSEEVAGVADIGGAHGRLWPRVEAAMEAQSIERAGPSVAVEAPTADPIKPIRLTVAVPIPDGSRIDENGVTTAEIPALARVAVTVITGDSAFGGPDFNGGWNALRGWAEASGETGTGEFRELYLDCDGPRTSWVVEVQMALS